MARKRKGGAKGAAADDGGDGGGGEDDGMHVDDVNEGLVVALQRLGRVEYNGRLAIVVGKTVDTAGVPRVALHLICDVCKSQVRHLTTSHCHFVTSPPRRLATSRPNPTAQPCSCEAAVKPVGIKVKCENVLPVCAQCYKREIGGQCPKCAGPQYCGESGGGRGPGLPCFAWHVLRRSTTTAFCLHDPPCLPIIIKQIAARQAASASWRTGKRTSPTASAFARLKRLR